ncbi:hypothetical protein EDC04DRAFT_3035134 [Pisolithus marmoratus]|nr:hypothetical protein EDC04DRAFT_3035134 [Pisolithus marmoratus]
MSKPSILEPEPQPGPKWLKQQSSLEEEWEKANARIHNTAQFYRDDPRRIATLLVYIFLVAPVEARPRARIPLLPDSEKLIEAYPEIAQALESAIESGHYEGVLSLPALTGWDCNIEREKWSACFSNTSGEQQPFWDFRLVSDDIRPLLGTKYQGNYHEVMLKNINSMHRAPAHASSATIIQSSGIGKSHTVHELATLVFTIPFNIRHPKERMPYPPEDTSVWEYFCKVSNVESVNHGKARTLLFLARLFSHVSKEIKRVFVKPGAECKLPPCDLAYRWREHTSENTRHSLYEKIINACEKDEPRPDANLWSLFHESAKQFNQLLNVLNAVCTSPDSRDVRILLYFDEAHELGHTIPDGENKLKLYDVVCSCLKAFQCYPIFTLFLSTEPLVLSAEVAGSAQQCRKETFQALLTEMPFDCHATFPLRPETIKLEQLGDLQFLARFGRPLFWTIIEASKAADKSRLIESTMDFARAKLVHANHICEGKYSSLSSLAMLATLDVLITIDYEPRQHLARTCELEMIVSHMRIAFSASQDGSYIRSGYPSEPFLAEAASRQMYHCLKSLPYSMSGLLRENINRGLIDLSQKTEIIMRFLLRMAYIDAIVDEQAGELHRTGDPNFSKGCSFLAFLKALFADQFHDIILRSTPDNSVTSTCAFEDAFENAVVRFTHFVKAEDIDIVIPVLLDKHCALEESSMSALFIQVKRGQRRSSGSTTYITDKMVQGFFTDRVPAEEETDVLVEQREEVSTGEQEDTRPYVTLVAELGVNGPPKDTPFVVTGNTGGRSSARATLESTEGFPRYSIRAYGCTETTWMVVIGSEGDVYKYILGTDDLLADHQRQDEASLELVRQMLPFWHDGTIRYNPQKPEKSVSMNVDESQEQAEEGRG